MADELDEELRASSEDEREKEEERRREEERRINEEINRWAEEYEEEFEREKREEENQVAEQVLVVEASKEVPAGTVVEIVEPVHSRVAERMLEASSGPTVNMNQTTPVPTASRPTKRKKPVERTPFKKATSSKKKGRSRWQRRMTVGLTKMVNATVARRYEYIGYKDFE